MSLSRPPFTIKTKYIPSTTVKLVYGFYENDATALRLHDATTNEPIANVTVNVDTSDELDIRYIGDYVWIKDYSENEGMVEALLKAGVIGDMVYNSVQSGFVTINLYRLTKEYSVYSSDSGVYV